MALLVPASFEIGFKRFNRRFPGRNVNSTSISEAKITPRLQTKFRIRAQQQDQFSQQKHDKTPPAVRRAFEKAHEYKKKKQQQQEAQNAAQNRNDEIQSDSSKPNEVFDAFERAKAYRHQQGEKSSTKEDHTECQQGEKSSTKEDHTECQLGENNYSNEDNTIEVEIITRDGVIKRKFTPSDQANANIKDYRKKGISSMDFVGLDFFEKKPKGRIPAGLRAGFEPPPPGPLPEVEIIVGDVSKFGVKTPARNDDSSDMYKPAVTSWGVFPRPKNISKTYGGGKVIRPGGDLESKEEKEAREARTKKLINAYKEKMGQNVDPKVKEKCEKVLKEGNDLMEVGKLQDALIYFEKIMKQMVFQSELHGLAALQWAICFDSLNR